MSSFESGGAVDVASIVTPAARATANSAAPEIVEAPIAETGAPAAVTAAPAAEEAAPAAATSVRRDGATQTKYYDKWDKFAKEEVAAVEKEEKDAKAKTALGADGAVVSGAERADKDKRAALREVKKQWDNTIDEGGELGPQTKEFSHACDTKYNYN
jgi:hypothetical protein